MAQQEHGRGGGWFTTLLHDVTGHLVADLFVVVFALVAKPAFEAVWQRQFNRPLPGWAESIPYLGFVVALLGIWALSRLTWWIMTRSARRTPRAKGDKLSIYVAKFGDDEVSRSARERVIASIRSELGPERVEVLPAGMQLSLTEGVSDDSAAEDARKKARSLLRKKHGDLLIWGKVYAFDPAHPHLDLRFVSAEADQSRAEPFGFTDKLLLEPDFGVETGAALAAIASSLAAPVRKDAGSYLAGTLLPAASRLGLLASSVPTSMSANDRARLLHAFGLIQYRIGEQSGDPARLEGAVAALRRVLEVRTREQAPLAWAKTQNNIGAALSSLGERESGTERLEEAVAAFREALREYTRERVPLQWAMAQNNLGSALGKLGEREVGTERLLEAVWVLCEALQERTRERMPLQWATTQNNLGTALIRLGERERGTERLEEAVAAFREALKEWTRKRVPLHWAAAQNNLGTALASLGERESGTERLEQAVAAYRSALEVLADDTAPHYKTMARGGFDRATKLLEERKRKPK